MADLELHFNDRTREYDIDILSGDLKTGNGLESAVIISLFTWGRATAEEVPEHFFRYGWWGNKINEEENIHLGSKLYLLSREKITEESMAKAKEYIEQALEWLITDKIVSDISVTVTRDTQNPLKVDAKIILTKGNASNTMKFNDLWKFIGDKNE